MYSKTMDIRVKELSLKNQKLAFFPVNDCGSFSCSTSAQARMKYESHVIEAYQALRFFELIKKKPISMNCFPLIRSVLQPLEAIEEMYRLGLVKKSN